jgi:hypothetical protein
MLSIIRLKSAEEYEELQSEESRIAEYFSKNTLQTIQKNPESQNPFPRILCKQSRRIQNPFARTLFAKNPSFASPACCWVAADGRRHDEQEGTRTRRGARWGSEDSRPTLELFLMLSTLLL